MKNQTNLPNNCILEEKGILLCKAGYESMYIWSPPEVSLENEADFIERNLSLIKTLLLDGFIPFSRLNTFLQEGREAYLRLA